MNFIQRLINNGVHPGLQVSMVKRIRLLNTLCLSFIILTLLYSWLNSSIHKVAMYVNLASGGVALSVLLLARFRKYIPAIFLLMGILMSEGLAFSLLFGRYVATELIFCTGVAYAVAMFDKWYRIMMGVLLNIGCYIFVVYMYENYAPFYNENTYQLNTLYYINSIVFLFSLSALVYFLKQENIRVEKSLKQNNRELKLARKKTENLLLNILPAEVARELEAKGYVEPRYYNEVTVLFTDFYGFTQVAEQMKPLELVSELDVYFSSFDLIIEKYGIEKLKTIGDAFMCAGGLTLPDQAHARKMVEAALEIRDFVKNIKQKREEEGRVAWDVRIGIHTGPLVSGIIGQKKFAFDIWGDTVNTASRMESSSEPGKVNISGYTYALVKDHFITEYRGKVAPKNKGEIDMYFVTAKI